MGSHNHLTQTHGQTPLHLAYVWDDHTANEYLIKAGADTKALNNSGRKLADVPRYIDQETTEMREMPTMMHKWQGYLIGLPKEVLFLQTVIYAFYRNAFKERGNVGRRGRDPDDPG